jgi:hypothetical protein
MSTKTTASALMMIASVMLAPSAALAQVRATRIQPLTASQPEITLSPEDIADLKAQYDVLSDEDKAQIVAMYKDMGIDLLALFGEDESAPGDEAAAAPAQTLLAAVTALDFARTPQKVLEARAQLGLQALAMPGEDAEATDLAAWLHKSVIAGEWDALESFLSERAGDDAAEIYAHIVQSTNQGDPALLPEEVLAISEAAPGELTDWQLDVLAQLLKSAAAKSSTGPLLEQIRKGTVYFGTSDDEKRQRTAKFLSMAGLAVEAYDYLPSLKEARTAEDATAILAHAQYQAARASALGSRPEADQHRRLAWDLYCEVTLIDGGDFEQRRDSLRSAIKLLPSIPPATGTSWLREVFANSTLAPAALEAVALEAMTVGKGQADVIQRAKAILTMKDAVDTLLDDERIEIEQVRVPLRMLTLALVSVAEETITKRGPQTGVAAETTLLLRALPSERWRDTIEASLAVRAYKAFVGIALIADNADLALDLLTQGVERAPGASVEMADEFLRLWMLRLNPPQRQNQNQFIFYFGSNFRQASAPLTRGRQRRNLDRLTRLLDLLDTAGVDGRRLDRVVDAFSVCHGRAETYKRDSVISVLGPIEDLAPGVSSSMAEAMRVGLNGDWRSRDVQREEGNKRNESEMNLLVEEGYALAIDLIESAIVHEPDSWQHAMTRTALSYDLMQYRSERDQDAAAYNTARADLFRSFAEAARQYREAQARGEVRADPGVYLTWFSISLGSSDLRGLKAEDLLTEGAENEEQLELIRSELLAMDPDTSEQHIGAFARSVVGALSTLTPEVKPGVVRRAAMIVGDHPAGAPLRATLDLYEDLVRDEIQLGLTLDGPDRVGTEPFGAVLTLRHTAAIEREIGGFAQYLQNSVFTLIAGRYQQVDLRDRLEKTIEQAFDGQVELIQIGFFDSMNPSEPTRNDGEGGWEEKPIAYLVLRAIDESADHLPALQMDLNLTDSTGPVVLPVRSNTVLIDAVAQGEMPPRRLEDLVVTQTLDLRPLEEDQDQRNVTLEVTAVGRGVIPSLTDLLDGLEDVLEGYEIREDGIEEQPLAVIGVDGTRTSIYSPRTSQNNDDTYIKPDDDGVYRLTTSRTWKITFAPTGRRVGKAFRWPVLASGIDGDVLTERYDDMDLVAVSSASTLVHPAGGPGVVIAVGTLVLVVIAAGVFVVIRRNARAGIGDDAVAIRVPGRITPVTAVLTLQRIDREYGSDMAADDRAQLRDEIANLERTYFASDTTPDESVGQLLEHWIGSVREQQSLA